MLYTTQATEGLPPLAAAAAEYQVTGDETPKFPAESASEHSDHHAECSANPTPMLPPFWNCVPEEFHAEEEEDVWKELNAASPSILRHQWLWAYFNLPALRLSDHVVGDATLVAHTDGFRTHLHVICSLLQKILDLRNFSGIRMLFRSELRCTRSETTEFLLMDALYAFGGMAEQVEAAYDNQDELQLVEREYDMSTGSTLLPGTSEGTQERGTPNSAADGDQLDEHDGTKSSEARSEAIHRTSSSVQSDSCPGSGRRPAPELAFSESAGNAVTEHSPSKTPARDGLPQGPSLSQARQLSTEEPRRSLGNNIDLQKAERREDTDEVSVQDDQPVAETRRSDCSNHLVTIVAQHPTTRVTRSAENSTEPGTTAASSEKDDGSDIPPCFSPNAEKVLRPLEGEAPGNCLSEAGISDKGHHFMATGLQHSNENSDEEDQQSQCADSNEACVENENGGLDEQPKKPTLLSDEVLEKELLCWMMGSDYDGDTPCGGYFVSTEENWCPSHEFEYWAIENTAWAFCRTAEGTMGYVPTVAIPNALRNMANNTRMYARRTAYVDRFCKWKQTVLYPGDAVVILADRGRW
ncbi:hypothetical protein Emag_003053 [Eimeria magna]